ncbi:potassium channel subfamily K member 6-like [Dromaius novaehollandiae]|uniref:potassium channel subfamily K member 6-like n=1 Tax=Dromaius novaehollandiae TaxID=8790 RepID=UPI0031204535
MGRGAALALLAAAYAGLLLLGAVGLRALERPRRPSGPSAPPNASDWDLASAFLFATTLLTTVGYGYAAPRTDGGKVFCAVYAALGVPVTMLVLTAAARRLMGPVTERPLRYLQARGGFSRRGAARAHLALLLAAVLALFLLLPAAAFRALEGSWSYLDALYFCTISLSTIGLGDLVPGERPGQRLRELYKVAVAAYLLLGLTAVLLLAQTFQRVAELHGLPAALLPPAEPPEEAERLLSGEAPVLEPRAEEPPAAARRGYTAINR